MKMNSVLKKEKKKILIEAENELASTLEVINKEAEDGSTESRATYRISDN